MPPLVTSPPEVPPELLAAPPRRLVRRPALYWKAWRLRLFLLPHTLVGFAALFFVLVEPLFLCLAPRDPAVVKIVLRDTKSKGDQYSVIYHYSTESFLGNLDLGPEDDPTQERLKAPIYRGEDSLPANEAKTYRPGSRLVVSSVGVGEYRYTAIPKTLGRYVRSRWFFWLWTAFWCSIMSVFLNIAWVIPYRARKLVRDGRAVMGKLMNNSPSPSRAGDHTRVKYEFTPDGETQPRRGKVYILTDDYQKIREGQDVTVLYDPAKPNRSTLYEYADVRAATMSQ